MNTSLYLPVQAGFILLTVVYIALLLREFRKAMVLTTWDPSRKKRFMRAALLTIFTWGVFVTVWSLSGRMSDFSMFPFNLLPVLLIPVIMLLVFITSKGLNEVLQKVPPANLIRLQSFRFFVEILLWMLFIDNLLPVQLTFEGRNFDILAGITAPVIAWLAVSGKVSKNGILIWNILCLGLLLNIVITAILSTPSPWRVFMNEPANTIVADFPISWLPGFLVPLAYYLHIFSLKQIFQTTAKLNTAREADPLPVEK